MKNFLTVLALSAAITLGACNKEPEAPAPKPTPTKTAPAKTENTDGKGPMTTEQVKVFAKSFEDAMRDVPPELRADFQKYWECEVKKNLALAPDKQQTMDAKRVIEMTAALKANKALAACS